MPELYHVGLKGVDEQTENPFQSEAGKALLAFCKSKGSTVMHIGNDARGGRVYLTEAAAEALAGESFVAPLQSPGDGRAVVLFDEVLAHEQAEERARQNDALSHFAQN